VKKILFHYAKIDEKRVSHIRKMFARSTEFEIIDLYDMVPGSRVKDIQKERIREADAVVFFLSSDFYANDECYDLLALIVRTRRDLFLLQKVFLVTIRLFLAEQEGILLYDGQVPQNEDDCVCIANEIKERVKNENS
jgi:hypothetical protein